MISTELNIDDECDLITSNKILEELEDPYKKYKDGTSYSEVKYLMDNDISSIGNEFRKKFTTDDYECKYEEISSVITHNYFNNNNITRIVIYDKCNLIDNLELLLPKIDDITYTEIFLAIEIIIGGISINKICKEQFFVNHWLYKRTIYETNDLICFPIILEPDMFPIKDLKYNELHIDLKYHPKYLEKIKDRMDEIKLFGNRYTLNKFRPKIFKNLFRSLIIQNGMIEEKIKCLTLNIYHLYFNHPTFMIYIANLDKTKIKNIRLELEDKIYYDGDIETLEKIKYENKIYIEPIVILFTEKFNHDNIYKNETINFSKTEILNLTIDNEDIDIGTDFIIGCFNYNVGYLSSNMYCPRYSF